MSEEPDFLDGARLEYEECLKVRRLLGYLWTATGYRSEKLAVADLFAEDDPIREDVARFAIFPEREA